MPASFKSKRLIFSLVCALIPTMAFIFSLVAFVPVFGVLFLAFGQYFAVSLVIFIVIAILFVFLSSKFLSHPLLSAIEGKGLLVGTFDSSGVIDLFNVEYTNPPDIVGGYKNKEIETIFDRDLIHTLVIRDEKVALTEAEILDKKKKVIGKKKVIVLPDRLDDASFALGNRYPFLIFNKNLNTFMSKQALSELEKTTFIKHLLLHLLKKTDELARNIRDFGRYVVEATKPRRLSLGEIAKKWWFWLIIIIIVIVLFVFIAPLIMQGIGQIGGGLK